MSRETTGFSPIGRPPKTLVALIELGTFRISRHLELLEREPLPASSPFRGARRQRMWDELRELQRWFCMPVESELDARERHAIARDFAAVVRALHGGVEPDWLREKIAAFASA